MRPVSRWKGGQLRLASSCVLRSCAAAVTVVSAVCNDRFFIWFIYMRHLAPQKSTGCRVCVCVCSGYFSGEGGMQHFHSVCFVFFLGSNQMDSLYPLVVLAAWSLKADHSVFCVSLMHSFLYIQAVVHMKPSCIPQKWVEWDWQLIFFFFYFCVWEGEGWLSFMLV